MRIVPETDGVVKPGQRFTRWTVLGREFYLPCGYEPRKDRVRPTIRRRPCVVCQCDCGTIAVMYSRNLIGDRPNGSCGCLQKELASAKATTHGCSRTRIYNIWSNMIKRCTRQHHPAYPDYGGRGIRVCEEWLDVLKFESWAMASGYEEWLSIDRINNNGNYEPSNCRWVGKIVQANNTRANHLVTAFGETKTAAEWSRDPRCTTSHNGILARLNRQGLSPELAISRPKKKNQFV